MTAASASSSGGVGDVAAAGRHVLRRQPEPGTIFGLGIMPYISASIIFQLLASVYPPLEKLQKEGEAGRKKINEYTRYATVVICLVQSWFWISHDLEPRADWTASEPGVRRLRHASGTSRRASSP